MARIRSVKPNLFSSYSMAKLPIEARYLFVGLFCEADDEGQLIDSPKKIAGAIFPHDEKVTERKVNGWLDNLHEVGSIIRYTVEGNRFIAMPEWLTHQRVSHPTPSVFPAPSFEALEEFMRRSGKCREALIPEGEGKGKGN